MTELRQAAEMALNYFEDAYWLEDTEVAIKEALRQALAEPEQRMSVEGSGKLTTKPYPDSYESEQEFRQTLLPVKTYAGGKPNYCTPDVDAVNMTQDRVDETAKVEHPLRSQFVTSL